MTAYLFTVRDPLGQEVRLTESSYKLRILLEQPELFDINDIANTITSPDLSTHDAVDLQRLVYYRTYQAQPQRWMKVVVEHGEVVTAYRVRRLKQGEIRRWQRSLFLTRSSNISLRRLTQPAYGSTIIPRRIH